MSQGVIENLIEQLSKLPGIGRKTAQRLAFFILNMKDEDASALAGAVADLKRKARFCRVCFNITDSEFCGICRDSLRDKRRICVVEEPSNILVVERSGGFNGLYHVLMGALSPIDGITPEMLRIKELVERVRGGGVEEVVIATNPNTKGELTARHIKEALGPLDVAVTRIAYGLPLGGDIEFADEITMKKSLEGRRAIE
ncbi:MAG: recombination mediator RecR [Nitrospiraceae bacterium]|nr:recombination mediator RecR [Nitrospiraceae bacterium]